MYVCNQVLIYKIKHKLYFMIMLLILCCNKVVNDVIGCVRNQKKKKHKIRSLMKSFSVLNFNTKFISKLKQTKPSWNEKEIDLIWVNKLELKLEICLCDWKAAEINQKLKSIWPWLVHTFIVSCLFDMMFLYWFMNTCFPNSIYFWALKVHLESSSSANYITK